ncbi:phage tail protein, partial [Providencia rettgeri]|nr:phage tail protein [Providencia rettgeri]
NKNQIIAEQIIPEQDGGWWIREIGLFDKAGNLIAVANCPETYKPQLAEGSGRTQSIRIVLIVSHTESVTLKIDPSVVLATREYVNTEITVLDKKIDALSAQTKLDLNKKFDKANISGVKGNDNDKVPSLHLFTTEIGKLAVIGYSYSKVESDGRYQPKGNYAPAGDYSTNAALNNGLGLKLDKTSVVQSTGTSTTQVISQDAATKNFIKRYEYGLGNVVSFAGIPANSEENPFGGTGAVKLTGTPVSNGYNGLLYMTQGGEFKLAGVTISGSGARGEVSNFYSDKNTYKDRNGYVKTSKTAEDIQSVPIGASIIWNTSASIPDNFWPNEGRSFSAAEYPELAKIFPALKLPDDRGYGIRIADNGRGIDAGRTVGTYQEDAMQRIQGKVEGGTYALFWSGNPTASGAFKRTSSDGPYANSGTINGNQSRGLEFDSGSVVRTADETRMKNVAKILITRVK